MKKGEKYLSGELDLGVNGKTRLLAFANKNKEKEIHPDFRLFVDDEPGNDDSNLKQVGVLWKQEKKGFDRETSKDEVERVM